MTSRRRALRRWRSSGAAVAAVVALLATGCGGDSDDLSREEFVREADQICSQRSAEFARIQRVAPTSAVQAQKQVEALLEVEEEAYADLRDLEPPAELRPAYDRYLRARERALGFLEQGREAAANQDPQAYNAAKRRAASEQAQRLQLARRVGLRRCSRPSLTLGR